MDSLSAWFGNLLFGASPVRPEIGKVITVIGSGGKTSLIWHLAASFGKRPPNVNGGTLLPRQRVLVTPTTKMFVPAEKTYDRYRSRLKDLDDEAVENPSPGITLAGIFNPANGKLESLPPGRLETLVPRYDLVLAEGDGSRGLPLKAWAEGEPVVPSCTGMTVGVIPLWPLGQPVSEKLIHRLPLFTALTGAEPGESLKTKHFARIISGGAPDLPGLFAKARGERILFLSQVEDGASLDRARELAEILPPAFREELRAIIAGSVYNDKIEKL